MKWLEIIELQTSGNQKQDMNEALEILIADLNRDPGSLKIHVCHSYLIDGDKCISISSTDNRSSLAWEYYWI